MLKLHFDKLQYIFLGLRLILQRKKTDEERLNEKKINQLQDLYPAVSISYFFCSNFIILLLTAGCKPLINRLNQENGEKVIETWHTHGIQPILIISYWILFVFHFILYEPRCEKTGLLPMRKQRCRSASR